MFLGRHTLPRCAGSQVHRPAAVAHRSAPSTFLAARHRLKATLSTPPHVEKPLLPRHQPQATASSHPGAQQTPYVEYQVAGSTFSISLWGGTGSRQQPLLRLQEQSDVSEYVLVLPQSLSGVLHEVLEKAVRCVETGNAGKPLELHHTILQGNKTFRCSLVYDPTAAPISSHATSRDAAVAAGLMSEQQQLVEVTVHELGRSCVHLPVCSAVLEPVRQLLQLLRSTPQQQAVSVGPAASPRHQGEAVAAKATPAAGPDITARNGNGSSHLISVPADAAAAQLTALAENSRLDAAANDDKVELDGPAAAASSSYSSSSSSSQQQQQHPLSDPAGLHPSGLAAATEQSEPEIDTAEAASEAAAAGWSLAAAAESRSSSSSCVTSLPEAVQQDVMDAADGNGKPSQADAAAASQQDDVASGERSASAAAAIAAPPAASRAAPEVLFDAINSSSALKDGFKFAHAADAESLGSSSSSPASRVFQLSHLCLLWQKLPSYAAGLQREVLQVGPDVEDDEVLMSAGPLYPEAQQELQALVDVLVPILQPQLPQLPRHMLQRLLQAAADASVQLPASFLPAWAAAAAAPSARGSWEGEGPAALLDVSLLLVEVQARPQQQLLLQQQQQMPVQLPLQWCAYALEEACQHIQQAEPQLLGQMWGDAAADEAAAGASQEVVDQLQGELVPVLLAACGHQLQQQQLLWQSWGHSSSSKADTDATVSVTAAGTEAWLASVAQSLQQLLGAASAHKHDERLHDIESALLPGLQQRRMLQSVLGLLAQQQAAAVALIWGWLAFGGGAQNMSSDLLRTLLEQLPYDDAAAAYMAATQAAAAAAGDSAGSSDAAAAAAVHRAGKPAEHSSLLEHVLHAHTQGRGSAGADDSTKLLQLEAVSGLLGLALQIDARAAFAALPSLLSALPPSAPAGSNTAAESLARTSSSNTSSGQQWDAAVALLCDQLQHMLQLGPQQLLSCALVALKALTQLSTAPSATPQSMLCILQLAQELADLADSWHAAAASPQLQELQLELASLQTAEGTTAEQQVPTAAAVVECCWGSAPLFAQACSAVLQQDGQQLLPRMAELLQAAAALQDAHGDHRSLQPDWLPCRVAPSADAAGAQAYSSSITSSSSSGSLWAPFEPVLLAAAAQSRTNALDAADVAAAASALLQLGLPPSEQLLQAYWDALDPEALGLTAVGLQQLLWITAALVHQHQQQTKTASHTAQASSSMSSSSSSSGSHMLRLATKACSSLSVRSASALSAQQAARVTWALASLACSDAAAAASWTPPQQILSWLRRVWQGMDAASGRGATSSNSSSRFGATANGVVLGLQAKILSLQDEQILHQQEAGELQWALQQLRLLPQQADAKSAQAQQQQQQQQEDLQNSPALAEVQPQQQQQEQEKQQQQLHEEPSMLHKLDELLLHKELQEGGSQQPISAQEQQEKQQQQEASHLPQQPLQSAQQHLQQQQQRPSARPLPGRDGTRRLLQQQQLLRQGQAGWDQSGSRYAVHDFAAQRPAPAAPARAASAAPPQPAAAGRPGTAASGMEAEPPVEQAAAAPAAAGEIEAAQVSSTAAAVPSTPPAAAVIPQAAEVSTTESAPHQQDVGDTAAAGAKADSADAGTADAPAAAAKTAESASTAPVLAAAAASPPAVAAPESSGVISAASGAVTPVPPSVAAALQQLKEPSFNPTQKQAMQLLLPVQQHTAALSPSEILLYAASCFKHKVPLCSSALLTVGTTAAAACSAAQARSAEQANTTEVASAPASLLLQLLSATAAAIAAPVGTPGAEAASEAEAAGALKQRAPHLLQQLLPDLGSQQLVLLSASELLQLLRDVFTISTGQRPPKATVLPVGSTLFGPAAISSIAGSNGNGAGPAVEALWLKTAAEVLQRKLLLFPHGSQLLQSLQLLQVLGLRQPSSSFMASFLEAADALLDTLSGRNCLELLAAVAAAGTLPSKALGAALLQHLVPLKLSPTDVAAGCRLLAALSIRPSAELLLRWFDTTEAAAEQLQPSGVLQMLWACCIWQVQPPTTWLEAVVKSLLPVGRLTSCSPATLAGLCRCLWQLGVQPAPGFVAAVAAAAEYSMTAAQGQSGANGSSSSGSWAYWQQGRQQHRQPEVPSMDAESLSVLCYCFYSWQHSGTPAWRAAVAERAAALMDGADGLSVLRLALYLAAQEHDQEGLYDDADELLPWQQMLLTVLPQLLHSTAHAASQEVILTADGAAEARRLPTWALVVLSYVLSKVPEQSLAVLRGMIAAIKASAEQELLTSWDIMALWPSYQEFLAALQHSAETASGPLAGVQVKQLQQEAEAVLGAAQDLLKYAYQQRSGAPADVLEALPMLAADFGIGIPQQSHSILQAAVATARQREEQLQQALLLQEQGGPAVPESLLQGLSELKPDDGDIVIAQYANSPLQAALGRRLTWLGAAVSDDWVVRGLSNA